jgi:hypothetical protein
MYDWMDKTDPMSFDGPFESDYLDGFKHYRREWDRLSKLITASYNDPNFDLKEREAMRQNRNHAAARVIGFSHKLIAD